MKIDVKFTEETFPVKFDDGEKFNAKFGNVFEIKDGYTQAELDKAVSDATKAGYADGEVAGYEKGHTAGQVEGYEQGKIDGNVSKYASVFRCGKVAFPEGYELVVSCLNTTDFPQCNNATGLKKVILKDLSLEKQYTATNFVYACESVEEIVLIDGVRIKSANYMCTNAYGLKRIIGAMDVTGDTNSNKWIGCKALEEIRFVANTIGATISFQHSANLSDASIQSIIDGLADLTGQTQQKVTFHTAVLLKLTTEQITAITEKNWTF